MYNRPRKEIEDTEMIKRIGIVIAVAAGFILMFFIILMSIQQTERSKDALQVTSTTKIYVC